tara:strand:+ start:11346 stop:11807 length:462 start_codon:yes stop_codon:yes gene_type:complete
MIFTKQKPRCVLGLDIGEKRVGLAYCDALHITVSILPAVKRTKDFIELNLIKEYINIHNIKGIIAGLPLDDNGFMTKQAIACKSYGEFIFNELKLPFAYVNEHSSTWESLNRFGLKKDKTGLIDSLSAKIILEQWIIEGPELKEYVFNNQDKH